jgi:choline dehydrogenase
MYDYVIVGAGSAGCVLAHRLSEDPDAKVLLVEAGGADSAREVRIPAAFSSLFRTPVDWAYDTEPQPRLKGRRLFWPRGKLLGGSSSLNAMISLRGIRADFDAWAAAGNDGWDYASVLPYFKRGENQERGASEYHGTGGPLNVADLRTVNPVSRAFVAAAVEAGLPPNDDFNGARQEGAGFYQVTQKRGARHSAAAAYLVPAFGRKNLTVWTNAHATSVIFEGTRAAGVRVVRDGAPAEARASREVLLAGGAINSPQLLMLSGVGPADHLRSLGIPVVADAAGVGRNLQDHLLVPIANACTRPVTLATAARFDNVVRYLVARRGPLSSNVAEAGGFTATRPGLAAPDLQLHFGPVYYLDHGFTKPNGHGFTVAPTLVAPASRGRVTLSSSDPYAAPCIDPNYFESEADLRVLVDGVELAREIIAARPLGRFRGAEVVPENDPRDRAAIAEFVRATAETIYHPVGTCRMGCDDEAVVDARLRVRGVEGLRVVDASVMPTIVRGNTNAATMMIAERASDLIRDRA